MRSTDLAAAEDRQHSVSYRNGTKSSSSGSHAPKCRDHIGNAERQIMLYSCK